MKRILITILLLQFSFITAIAQNSVIDSTTVFSVEAYQPFLNEAIKIKKNPSINDTTKIIPQLKYA
ncbi:MAG: hypothetical protein CO022_06250, partial [Flavobacteriales bacterium CG_4_9_14_0_2_um_filter_32_27]